MIALADVRRWDAAALETTITALATSRDALVELDYGLAGSRPTGWTGAAADRAGVEHERIGEQLRRIVAGASAVRRGVAEAADSIAALHDGIAMAEALAAANGFFVGVDGTITDIAPPVVAAELVETVRRERTAISAEVVDRLEQVLRRATQLDTDLAQLLARTVADQIDDGAATTLGSAALAGQLAGDLPVPAPPVGGAVGDNAGWWASLTPAEQLQVTRDHPEWIGNLNGIPAADRDTANRALFDTGRARLDSEIAATEARLAELTGNPLNVANPLAVAEALTLDARRHELRDQQATYQAVQNTIDRPDRHLLLLDLDRDHPRAAVAVRDIDTADHVAVFTPGFTSNIADSLGNYDYDVAALRDTAAGELNRAERYDESVAAVTFIGYDAPQIQETLDPAGSVVSSHAAAQGGTELAGLLDGINASRADDPHLTAVGHSYGSTTTGYALQEAVGVDNAVLFGSPGGSTDDINDLNLAPGQLGVIEARGDPVADLGRFGTDPNQLDGTVGLSAQQGHTPDGRPVQEVTGHSDYLVPGTSSQYNIASTVAGLDEQRILGGSEGVGDDLRSGDPLGAIERVLSPP